MFSCGKNTLAYMAIIIQAIASSQALFAIQRLGILSQSQCIAAATILVVLIAFAAVALFVNRKLKCAIIILSIFLSTSLTLLTFAAQKADAAITDITTSKGEYYDRVVVAVKQDSDIQTIGDVKSVGVQYTLQEDLMRTVEHKIKNENGAAFQTKEYKTIVEQVIALENGEVDAVIYNSTYADLISEQLEGSHCEMREILSYNITQTEINQYMSIFSPEETEPPAEITETTEPQQEEESKTKPFVVYISGIDVYGSITKNSRSDVNIIAVVNPGNRKILLVTTPRDYYVEIPGVSDGMKDKLTHAGIYGVNASMDTLSALYDVDIDYYVRVNFTSFEDIIDALGGVTVYSEYSFSAKGYTFQKGYNDLGSEAALVFVRERMSFASGDNQRGKNQEALIKAIIEKMCSPVILESADEILESVKNGIDTNVPAELIKEMIRQQLSNNRQWDIEMMAASGFDSSGETYSMPNFTAYVMEPNMDSVNEIKKSIKSIMTN